MAYADPQSLTVGSSPGAVSLPRTGSSESSGKFVTSDGKYSLLVRHTLGPRYRHNCQFRFDDIVSNPLVTGQSMPVYATADFTVNMPRNGLSTVQVTEFAAALATWLTANSNANLVKLLGGEN